MRPLIVLGLAAATAACSDPVRVRTDVARITVEGRAIVVANIAPATLYTFVVDRNALALIDWVPCNDPARCTGVAPGAAQRIAFEDVAAYQPGSAEAVVYHWLLVHGNSPSGFVMDSLRATIVPLR